MKSKPRRDLRAISEMRNLGPACQQDLNAVGIECAQDLKELGPEASFVKLINGRIERGLPSNNANAAYLYAMYGAIHDLDWREIPESKKLEFKEFAAEIRASIQRSAPAARRSSKSKKKG